MPVRVELIAEAVADLERYSRSGNLKRFLAKLLRIEEVGADAGESLGGNLQGFRKIVVGDRNWRILFSVNKENTVATVWVIGDREDSEVYAEAASRIKQLGETEPVAESLASAMFELLAAKKKTKRRG